MKDNRYGRQITMITHMYNFSYENKTITNGIEKNYL